MTYRFARTLAATSIVLIFTLSGISCFAAENSIDAGILQKKEGDSYAAKDDYRGAAGHYIRALSLARDQFTIEERIQICKYMSWGGELVAAQKELRLIVAEDRQNLPARLHLARVLSWSGQLKEAIEISDSILQEFPDNKDARLIKANSLRWGGQNKEAMQIYNELLGGEEDFDARLGLTYSLLQRGDIKGARENAELIKPQYSYQERELQEFYAYMSKETRQAPDVRYDHYNDSDDNQYDRYTLGFGFRLNNWRGRLAYVYTSASDNTRDNSESSVSVNVSSKLSDRTDIKAGLGITMLSNSDNNTFLAGNAGISRIFGSNVIGMSVARSYMTSTAELIDNRIRMDIYSVNYDYTLNSRTSLNASLSYRDYSDDNTSFEIQAAPRYMLYTDNPGIAIGYRLRYLDFENDSNGGYFDPDTFISNELFSTVSYEKGRFYCYLEPYAGHQYFRRSGSTVSDIFGGGYSILGYKIQKNTSIEVSAEGGNYAMSSASGFRYYTIGLRLSLLL